MYTDRLLIFFILGAYLLSPALLKWWSGGHPSWYQPYAIWALLILLSYWVTRKNKKQQGDN